MQWVADLPTTNVVLLVALFWYSAFNLLGIVAGLLEAYINTVYETQAEILPDPEMLEIFQDGSTWMMALAVSQYIGKRMTWKPSPPVSEDVEDTQDRREV